MLEMSSILKGCLIISSTFHFLNVMFELFFFGQVRRRRFRKRRPKGTSLLCSDSDSDQEKMITNDSSNKKFGDSDSDDVEFFAQQRYSLSRFYLIVELLGTYRISGGIRHPTGRVPSEIIRHERMAF